jgi:hypothetical protein
MAALRLLGCSCELHFPLPAVWEEVVGSQAWCLRFDDRWSFRVGIDYTIILLRRIY